MTDEPARDPNAVVAVDVDAADALDPVERTVPLTLATWQWSAVDQLAAYHGLTVNDVLARWTANYLAALVTGIDVADEQ